MFGKGFAVSNAEVCVEIRFSDLGLWHVPFSVEQKRNALSLTKYSWDMLVLSADWI